jgi:hypothetical protein
VVVREKHATHQHSLELELACISLLSCRSMHATAESKVLFLCSPLPHFSSTTVAIMKQRPCTHLIIVCCNSIYHGNITSNPHDESNWALKSFQKSTPSKQGEHETLIQHIQTSVEVQQKDSDSSIVVFSGGPTGHDYPDLSEAQSYLNALQAIGTTKGIEHILLDEAATDSFQNLIFSVMVFRKHCGYYPFKITIVAHSFKERRFLDLHAKAIRWPADRIRVLGIDPPFSRRSTLPFKHQPQHTHQNFHPRTSVYKCFHPCCGAGTQNPVSRSTSPLKLPPRVSRPCKPKISKKFLPTMFQLL